MTQKRKGQLTQTREWAKHLRPYYKRCFWKSERAAEQKFILNELEEITYYTENREISI